MVRLDKLVLVLSQFLLVSSVYASPMADSVASFSTRKALRAGQADSITAPTASLQVTADALKTDLTITVSSIGESGLPKLDRGMTNVTDNVSGYRFLPHGEHFQGNGAKVVLGYDRTKIPSGYTEDDIRTYYYDEAEGHWVALKRDSVDRRNRLVVSHTTHFTDMINGVIQVPESPETQGFAPTMMSELKAADPTAKVQMIEAPQPNSKGSANLSYSLEMPPARNGMSPNLTINYSSDAGSGWLGEGWNLSTSAITIDTRWGVPRYDGTETYLLDGEMLVKGREEGTGDEKVTTYHPRREGAFSTILRYGSRHGGYRWEVIDRKGTRYSYGQWKYYVNEQGKRDSVLTGVVLGNYQMTSDTVAAEWHLTRIEEIHGDYVEYKYREDREPVGLYGTVQITAKALYLDSVMAGNANDAPHTVVRLVNRKEPKGISRNDARYGFLVSNNALLDSVSIYFEGKFLRGYTFAYKQCKFYTDLLEKITQIGANKTVFSTHTLDYHDEVGSNPSPFGDVTGYTSSSEYRDLSMINGGKTTFGNSNGGGCNAGVGPVYGGVSYNYSENTSESKISLTDINGDGLPDKVYKKGSSLYYEPAVYGGNSFGPSLPLKGAPQNFTENNSYSHSLNEDVGAGLGFASVGATFSQTWENSNTKSFFYDVNNDGLMDIVSRGIVYFNHLEDGIPVFSLFSSETDNELGLMSGAVIPKSDGFNADVDTLPIRDSLENKFPMHDAVRVWRAPVNGTVNITGAISLRSQSVDGVNYFIQHQEKNLANGSLKVLNESKEFSINDIPVKAGDYILFRTNSVDNGVADRTVWIPEITYSEESFATIPTIDEKGLDLTSYNAGKDYIPGISSTVACPGKGYLKLLKGFGYKKLEKTLADVTFEVQVKIGDTVKDTWSVTVGKDDLVDDGSFFDEKEYANEDTDKSLVFDFSIKSEIPFNDHAVSWTPVLSAHLEKDTLSADDTLFVSPSRPMYNKLVKIENPVVVGFVEEYVGDDGHEEEYRVVLKTVSSPEANGCKSFLIEEGNRSNLTPVSDSSFLDISNWEGKQVRLVTYSDTPLDYNDNVVLELWMNQIVTDEQTNGQKKVPVKVQEIESSIWSVYSESDQQLGLLYRGWGQFAYKGDVKTPNGQYGHSVSETIDIKALGGSYNVLKDNTSIVEALQSDTSRKDNPSEQLKFLGSANTNLLAPMHYDAKERVYFSTINLSDNPDTILVSSISQNCSRLGKSFIDVKSLIPVYPTEEEMKTGVMPAPSLQNKSFAISGVLSGGLKCGFGLSGTYSHTTQNGRTAYMDLNGDGYPDWISDYEDGLSVSYTKTDGTLQSAVTPGGTHLPEQTSDAIAGGASAGSSSSTEACTSFNKGSWNFSKQNLKAQVDAAKEASSPFSVSLNTSVSSCSSESKGDWCDVNGDGLPDMVYRRMVALNLGYKFVYLDYEFGGIDASESTSLSVGGGFCVPLQGSANIGGGPSYSTTDNHSTYVLRDVNGDGLPDKVVAVGGPVVTNYCVFLNKGLGYGFEETASLSLPMSSLNESKSKSVAVHYNGGATVYFTIFSTTPFYNGSTILSDLTYSKTMSSLSDFDGDGFPDLLYSNTGESLSVNYSTIGATNKLKSVVNPFGGSFEIEYTKTKPTSDHPGGKWAMGSLTVSAGTEEQPAIQSVFSYSDGKRDRREREFLGFGRVATLSVAGDSVVRQTEQTYDVSSYLSAGALLRTVVKGADSTELYRKEETDYLHYKVEDGSKLTEKDLSTFSRSESAFTAPERKKVTAYEGAGEGLPLSEETFGYTDNYGNIKTYKFQDLTSGGRSYETTIAYANDKYGTANSVTVKGDDDVTYRHTTAEYTNTFTPWAITRIEQTLNDNQKARYKFEYDHFGNIARKESDSTFFIYTYDRKYNMYPERVEDAFGYRSEMEDYDYRFGIPLTVRDMNGYTVRYHVDDYGRVDTIVAPNEQSAGDPYTISYKYVNGKDYKARYAVTNHFDVLHPDDPVTTITHVDGLGRPYQVKKEAEVGGKVLFIVSGRVEYDGLGRTIKNYHPSTCTIDKGAEIVPFSDKLLSSTTYDAIDRPLSQTLPGDESNTQQNQESVTTTSYSISDNMMMTTVTAPNGNGQRAYTNGAGQTIKTVRELDGKAVQMVYFFDPIGQLDSLMDAKGNVTAYTYDKAGRRLSVKHPSTGLTTFKYDVAGNMVERETENLRAEKKVIKYAYEKNRLKQVSYPNHPENNVTYTYGGVNADFNRVGRVALVEDGSGATEFYYGKMGEIVKQRRTLIIPNVAVATYTTQWKYDSQNRILEMIYPDEEKITYLYNKGGMLNQVYGEKSQKTNYIDDIQYDAYEQKVYQKYGNGTETRYTYSGLRRRLAQLNVSSPHYDADIIRNSYFYDVMDNIDSLSNDADFASIASGEKPMGGKVSHRYHYDKWSRLTEAVGTFHSDNKSARYSLKMEYDEVYNVTRKKLSLEQNNLQFKGTLKTGHDFSYKYDSLNTFKQACVDSKEYRSDSTMVDTVSVKYAYEFDANGNQIKGGVRQMLWDEENRLLAVSEGGFMSNYFYDCNGERTVKLSSSREEVYVNAQQAYKDDSLPQKFVAYVSPYLVVKNGGQYTKHIYAGNQRIASKLGNIDDFGADPRRVDYAGADLKEMDFSKRYKLNNDELSARYDSLEIDCKFRVIDDYVNNQSFCCDNAGNEILADLGEKSATSLEPSIFYYHPDHLGSTAIVTDVDGRITQNVVYIPFGEMFVEQRDGNWNTPYLFNAKELDEETGLYYYGARYLDPTAAQWLSVDPLFEKYAGMSPYNYCNNSPVNLVDYDGKEADVTGEGAATYKVTLQSKCSGIKLKFEGNKLKYDRLKNSKGSYVDLSDNDNKIIGVLDDQDIKVHITALGRNKNTMKVNGELFTVFGGSFFGNVVSTVVDQVTNEEKIMVDAYQVVNPFVLLDMDDLSLSKHGTSALHEMMEAYYGATISKKKKISSPRAGLPGSVYKEAHKMAPQQPSVRMSYIDSNNKESLSPTDESAFEQFQVYRKNMSGYEWKTIIKLPYVKNNNE